jgi:TonB family protein
MNLTALVFGDRCSRNDAGSILNSVMRILLILTAGMVLTITSPNVLGKVKQQNPTKCTAGMSVTILTHTGRVDFNAYVLQFAKTVKHNWITSWPESAKAGEAAIVVARVQINKDGTLLDESLRMERSSGRDSFDNAAIGALRASAPFPSLPSGFEGSNIDLRITFFYNVPMKSDRNPEPSNTQPDETPLK